MKYLFMQRPCPASGQVYIVCKVTDENQRKVLSTGVKIPPGEWNAAHKLPTGKEEKNRLISWERRLVLALGELETHPVRDLGMLTDMMQKEAPAFTVADLIAYKMRTVRLRDLAPGTLAVYARYQTLIQEAPVSAKAARSFTADDGMKLYSYLCERLDFGTARQVMKLLRSAFHEAHASGLLPGNPLVSLRLKKKEATPNPLQVADLERLLHYETKGPRERARRLFLLLAYSGARYSDRYYIRPENVVEVKGCRILTYTSTKTKRPAYLPVNPTLEKVWGWQVDLSMSNVQANRYIKLCAAEAGLSCWDTITIHTGRITYGQNLLQSGFSLEAVAAALGHTDLRTTQRHYVRPGLDIVVRDTLATYVQRSGLDNAG